MIEYNLPSFGLLRRGYEIKILKALEELGIPLGPGNGDDTPLSVTHGRIETVSDGYGKLKTIRWYDEGECNG